MQDQSLLGINYNLVHRKKVEDRGLATVTVSTKRIYPAGLRGIFFNDSGQVVFQSSTGLFSTLVLPFGRHYETGNYLFDYSVTHFS